MLFLLPTSFTICHAILDCLSSTESLILWIWFLMNSIGSFRYILANSFLAFLSFRALILVGFLLLYLEAVFMSACFFLTANVSHGTLWTVLFQTIQFSISTQFSSIWPIDTTLSGVTTPSQSGPVSDGHKGVLHIPQSSNITGASPSDCLVSYTGHSLGNLTPPQRCSWCILQSTGPGNKEVLHIPKSSRALSYNCLVS